MNVSAEAPGIFISPQLAEQAIETRITGLTAERNGVLNTVNAVPGNIKPHVGALVLRGRGERSRNPSLLHLPPAGDFEGAPIVDLDAITDATQVTRTDLLRVRPRALTLEGLRRATYIAATRWHDAPGAWDEIGLLGIVGGGGLGLAADIIYNGIQFNDFSSLTEKAIASGVGAVVGVASVPVLRNAAYRSSIPHINGYPIWPQYSQAAS